MFKHKWIFIVLSVFVLFMFYLYYENSTLSVTYYEIKSSRLPKLFDGFKIVHVSDFHNSRFKSLNNDLVDRINEENPNIIVVTGDLIDSYFTNKDISIDFLRKLNMPIYYVCGNHERRLSYYNEFMDELRSIGVRVLENDKSVIQVNNDIVEIYGINDPINVSVKNEKSIIENELGIVSLNDNFKILLSHRPEFFESYVNSEVDLVFSGHTHGGGIILPYLGGVVAPGQGLFPLYDYGKFEKDSMSMIVSRGIGGTFPYRINNRPELVVVTLMSKE